MKLEIYLRSLSQEFYENDFSTRWWPAVHCASPEEWKGLAKSLIVSEVPLSRVFIRKEEFGSMIFDPNTQAILKADKEATSIISEIIKGKKTKDVFKARSLSESDESVIDFISTLRKLKLWD